MPPSRYEKRIFQALVFRGSMTVSILSSTWQDSFWVSSDWMTRALRDWKRSLEGRLGCVPVRQIVQRDAMGRKFYLHDAGMGEPKGEDLTLTLDLQVQFIAEEACARVAREFDGRWSGALVVEIASGDILAWAQYPFLIQIPTKPPRRSSTGTGWLRDALEPGSTFQTSCNGGSS